MTTSVGADTSARRASAGVWSVRVVSEKAFAYPGRRRLATTCSRYSSKSSGPLSGVELWHVGLPRARRPRGRHRDPEEHPLHCADLAVANERADEHEAADERGLLGRRDDGSPGAHRVADDDGRATELFDESEHVAGGLHVTVGGERRVAVAVTAQIGRCDSVARLDERGREEAIGRSQVAHPWDQDDEGAIPGDVVCDPPRWAG